MSSSQSHESLGRLWADADLEVVTFAPEDGGPPIFELRKQLVVNGVLHVQTIWLNLLQLRTVAIDQAL